MRNIQNYLRDLIVITLMMPFNVMFKGSYPKSETCLEMPTCKLKLVLDH